MTNTTHTLTVLFEDPFWIGLLELVEGDQIRVCKVTFGAEPTEQEVAELLSRNWQHLQYSPPTDITAKESPKNHKRLLREAKKQTRNTGIGTKSQQALKLQQEQRKTEHKAISRQQREAEKQRQFQLKQEKRKEKHKGH